MGNESGYNTLAVGGLVGNNSGSIYASSASVPVQGETAGGLVGQNANGTIAKSFASGDVEARNGVAGGLIGESIGGTIRSCYATGNVSGESKIGGIVGRSRAGTIQSSFAVGTVSAEEPETVGGLLGDNMGGSSLNKSYWDQVTTGQEKAVGKEFRSQNSSGSQTRALSTNEMTGEQARDNMKALDFDSVWRTVSGDYPELRIETP